MAWLPINTLVVQEILAGPEIAFSEDPGYVHYGVEPPFPLGHARQLAALAERTFHGRVINIPLVREMEHWLLQHRPESLQKYKLEIDLRPDYLGREVPHVVWRLPQQH